MYNDNNNVRCGAESDEFLIKTAKLNYIYLCIPIYVLQFIHVIAYDIRTSAKTAKTGLFSRLTSDGGEPSVGGERVHAWSHAAFEGHA